MRATVSTTNSWMTALLATSPLCARTSRLLYQIGLPQQSVMRPPAASSSACGAHRSLLTAGARMQIEVANCRDQTHLQPHAPAHALAGNAHRAAHLVRDLLPVAGLLTKII